MKKAVSFILAIVLCLSMCACGENSKETKLTIENIEDYFDFDLAMWSDGDIKINRNITRPDTNTTYSTSSLGSRAKCKLEVAGVSQNFIYSDISIVIRITGKYAALDKADIEKWTFGTAYYEFFSYDTPTIQLDLNVSGIGKSEFYYQIPENLYAYGLFSCDYEIIEVTGTITPVA